MAFDDAIAHDVLDLFGGSVDRLDDYTDAQIRDIINDQHKGGVNWRKARLCMYGTTALVALVDPDHQNLWVANVGDCQASEWLFLLSKTTAIAVSLSRLSRKCVTDYIPLLQSWLPRVITRRTGRLRS
jgi:hypothetical protein